MKKITRIAIMVMALMLCLSTVSFAALTQEANKYTLEGVLSADSVKTGETVTLTLYLYETATGNAVTLDSGANTAVTPSIIYPYALGEPVYETTATSYAPAFTDDGANTERYIDEAIVFKNGATFDKNTAVITYTFTATADVDNLSTSVSFYEDATGINDAVPTMPALKISVAAPAEPEAPTAAPGADVTVTDKDVVGKYAAKQFAITNTDEVAVYGFRTVFTPVYSTGADATKAVTKDFMFSAAEGVKAASFNFNAAIVGIPAEVEVVSVNIATTPITTK